MSDLRSRFAEHTSDFLAIAEEKPFVVFLCGPSLDPSREQTPAARLRKRIQDALLAEKFQVILGEDESIDNPSMRALGINLQDSELEFVERYCNSIVIVAGSVGSFCELGLFSWHLSHGQGKLKNLGFILLVDEQHEDPPSYLNQGPALAVHGFGRLDYVDFETFDAQRVVAQLRARRGAYTIDSRGRPRKSRA